MPRMKLQIFASSWNQNLVAFHSLMLLYSGNPNHTIFNLVEYPFPCFLYETVSCLLCVFRTDQKNKMAALASDWLRHFRLLLLNRFTEFNETWHEERSQRPLPSLCFTGWSEKHDGRPGFWLAETFSTSPLKPLNGIWWNLTGRKISTSSTKFVFFGPIEKKNKMTGLAFDWLRHFRLLLWNIWMACNETWQEERSQRPLPSLCFLGRSEKQDGRPGQSVKKVAHCTQVHDMWPFGPLVYVVMMLFGFFCGCWGFCHRTESDLFLFLFSSAISSVIIALYKIRVC